MVRNTESLERLVDVIRSYEDRLILLLEEFRHQPICIDQAKTLPARDQLNWPVSFRRDEFGYPIAELMDDAHGSLWRRL